MLNGLTTERNKTNKIPDGTYGWYLEVMDMFMTLNVVMVA